LTSAALSDLSASGQVTGVQLSVDFASDAALKVTATPGSTTRSVDIAGGTGVINRRVTTYDGGSVALAANAGPNPRLDVIELDYAGVISVTQGTQIITGSSPPIPIEPDRAAVSGIFTKVKLATVLVNPGDTNVSGQILDRRIFIPSQRVILVGNGAPAEPWGEDGDLWLDQLSGKLYGPKYGTWDTNSFYSLHGGTYLVESNWTPADGLPAGTPPGTRILKRRY
jgi:hypothetical protein